MSHYLPTRVGSYLLRLYAEFASKSLVKEMEIVGNCRFKTIENTEFDNYDGGSVGHDVRLYLPLHVVTKIEIKEQTKICDFICENLNELGRQVQGEYFRAVQIELGHENDPVYLSAIPFAQRPAPDPDMVPFWEPGLIRLFISHRDKDKVAAKELSEELKPYGISSFVAHDTIRPMAEWRKEIIRGLETMEIMLLFVTEDFSDSIWTMQEVGYALGADKPIVSLKLGKNAPPGFVNHEQGLPGRIDKLGEAARKLYPLLANSLGRQDRLQAALVAAFVGAPDWREARLRFERIESTVDTLSDKELSSIIQGFYQNDQLHDAGYLTHKGHWRLKQFLQKTTGKEFAISGRVIAPLTEPDDDVPF